jgi:multiple sugar transport system permease protein
VREKNIKSILIFAGVLFLLAFALSPFIWMMIISLSDRPDFLGNAEVDYIFTLKNYVEILTSRRLHFMDYFKNSLFISIIVSVAVSVIASFAGYAVSRLRFPGRIAVPLFVLAMSMFPQISIVGYLYTIFADLGLLNTYIALILPYIAWTVPIALWINMSYFAQIPVDLDKAALVDGASRTKTLFKVILPIALPGIFSSFLLVFIACFNEFLFAMMLTTDHIAQTIPVGIALFRGTHGEIPWGNMMAASAIASVPLVILTLIFQKYIVQGLSAGSVKG